MTIQAVVEWASAEDHNFLVLNGDHAWVQEELHKFAHEVKARVVNVVWVCHADHIAGEPCMCGTERYKVRL